MEKRLAGLEGRPASAEAEVEMRRLKTQGDQFLARYPTWKSLGDAVEDKRSAEAAARVPASAGPKALPVPPPRLAGPGRRSPPLPGFRAAGLWARKASGVGSRRQGRTFFTATCLSAASRARRAAITRRPPGTQWQIFLHHDTPLHYAVFYRDDGGPWELYFASEGASPGSSAESLFGTPSCSIPDGAFRKWRRWREPGLPGGEGRVGLRRFLRRKVLRVKPKRQGIAGSSR